MKDKFKKIQEIISIYVAKHPSRAVLIAILLFNIAFVLISALIISSLAPSSLKQLGFWESVFYTITMIIDAGCIQYIVADVGSVGVTIIIICLIIVMLGMIFFTGAVIGYVTNYISKFIEHASSGLMKLTASGHTVILNWNSRASEIINEFLYTGKKETLVVLVPTGKEMVEREIYDRISFTLDEEKKNFKKTFGSEQFMHHSPKYKQAKKLVPQNRLTIIVREGEIYSTKQLMDISVDQAKTILILSQDAGMGENCKYGAEQAGKKHLNGDSSLIKTLIQVADITSLENSRDNQEIVVETEDDQTPKLVEIIKKHKSMKGKCSIEILPASKILGQLLSQVSITPELNDVYDTLFSNKGPRFSSKDISKTDYQNNTQDEYVTIGRILESNADNIIPLTVMDNYLFYLTEGQKDVLDVKAESKIHPDRSVINVNEKFQYNKKKIVILGHNSKIDYIMRGFELFCNEWGKILDIMIIDDAASLEKYYGNMQGKKEYDYKKESPNNERDINTIINDFVNDDGSRTTILILSDDTAPPEEIDEMALNHLISISDFIKNKNRKDLNANNLDIIVEVLNPRNYDVVHRYSVNNIVVSNRYISRMMAQIGENEGIYKFYEDILTYDSKTGGSSKEIYIKKAGEFFNELPSGRTRYEFVRGVFNYGTKIKVDIENDGQTESHEEANHSLIIGCIHKNGDTEYFCSNQQTEKVEFEEDDKLIIFSKH